MDDDFGFDDSIDTGGGLCDIDFDSTDIDGGLDDIDFDSTEIDSGLDDVDFDDSYIDGGLDDIDFDSSEIDSGLDDVDFDSSDIDSGLDDVDFNGSDIDNGLDDVDFNGSDIDNGLDDVDFNGSDIDSGLDDVDFNGSDIDGGLNDIDFDDIEIEDIQNDDLQMDLESEELDGSLDFDTENDGYFESIPNEVEPFIMEEEQSENIPETNVAVPETVESDKTPQDAMRDYMYEHNYGQMDYPEYSQDTEWQALNEQYTASLENTPQNEEISPESTVEFENDILQIETENASDVSEEVVEAVPETAEGDKTPYEAMRDYIYEHDYTQMDYPEYSQDPEWQALNEQYTASPENTPQNEEISPESTMEFDNDISQTEDVSPVTEETIEVTEDISPVTEETIEVTEDISPVTEEANEITEDIPPVTEETNEVTEDIPPVTEETYDIPGSLVDSMETTSSPDIREYDDFETTQRLEDPEFYDSGQFYVQGINEYGFEGTCGPTSQANAVNTLLGNNELTENKVLELAVDNNLCDITDDIVNSGGTTTENFMELYDKVNESIGDKFNTEVFDYNSALSVNEMAEKLDEGAVLNVAVDSATLWGENDHIPGTLSDDVYTDHWITVTGTERTDTGEIQGFHIIDSGGGESYVDTDTYERMCFGEDGRKMIDPTCIVVSKKQKYEV